MGTVTKRQTKDGTTRYRAQVRVQRQGYPEFKQSKTFSKKSLAEEWIKRTEAEIELHPEKMLNPEVQLKQKHSENSYFSIWMRRTVLLGQKQEHYSISLV